MFCAAAKYRAGSRNARLTVHDTLGEQIHPRPQVLRPTIFWMNIQLTSTFDGRSNMRKKMLSSKRGLVVFSQQNHQFMFKPRSAACLAILAKLIQGFHGVLIQCLEM